MQKSREPASSKRICDDINFIVFKEKQRSDKNAIVFPHYILMTVGKFIRFQRPWANWQWSWSNKSYWTHHRNCHSFFLLLVLSRFPSFVPLLVSHLCGGSDGDGGGGSERRWCDPTACSHVYIHFWLLIWTKADPAVVVVATTTSINIIIIIIASQPSPPPVSTITMTTTTLASSAATLMRSIN